jgi:dihydrofolate synthase/folylpolyglutamate synthase
VGDRIAPAHPEYLRAITALFARTGTTAKLGLERTSALLARTGNPERRFATFHVAGTNGKGSVVAMLYALLRSKGFSVGRYTSPHLVDFRERIVVDDEQISADEVLHFLHSRESDAERLGATFFEITTVMALDHFARRGVDVAVIETGMGGRLDATNVITPLATGVTSVSMDHTEYLGDSIVSIAREKAGIFKPGVPAVVGLLPAEAEAEISRCARVAGARLVDASACYPVWRVAVSTSGTDVEFGEDDTAELVRIGLVGEVQAMNASIALTMLDAAGEPYRATFDEARSVLPGVRLAGRFQRIGKFVVDVAHNVDGIRALSHTLKAVNVPRPVVAVMGILRDKQWAGMIRVLVPVADRVMLASPTGVPADRRWDPEEVRRELREVEGIDVVPDLAHAMARAAAAAETVLVCGSFYTAGEALALLGVAPD